eukprot:6466340-Amphidinium_carterae.1
MIVYIRLQLFYHDFVIKGAELDDECSTAMSGSSSSAASGAARSTTEKNRDKRHRQAAARKMQSVTMNRAAVISSSDSDGFIHVSVEDMLPVPSKKQDKQIEHLECKLALLKAAKTEKTSSSTDSDRGPNKVCKQDTEETGFVDDEIKDTESNEELLAFARQLPQPEVVVDQALTRHLRWDMVGRDTTYPLCGGVTPEPPAVRSKGETPLTGYEPKVIQAEMVRNAHADDGGWNW